MGPKDDRMTSWRSQFATPGGPPLSSPLPARLATPRTPSEITGPVASALADFVMDEVLERLEDPLLGPPRNIHHEDPPGTTGTSRPEERTIPTHDPHVA